jgi:hypothetical protein
MGKDVKAGEYYKTIGVAGRGSEWAANEELGDKLWEWTQNQIEGY